MIIFFPSQSDSHLPFQSQMVIIIIITRKQKLVISELAYVKLDFGHINFVF